MAYFASRFASTDPDEIEERLRSRSARMHSRGGFTYSASFEGDESFSIGRSVASGAIDAEGASLGVTVSHTSRPSPWTSGRRTGDLGEGAVLFGSDRTYRSHSDGGNTATSVTFDDARIRAFIRAHFGSDARVRLRDARPVHSKADLLWRQLTDLICAAPLEQPLVRAAAYRALASAVCDTFTVVDGPVPASAAVGMRRRLFQRAADYLEANAGHPIGVEDAAHEVGVTGRELRRLFFAHAPLGHSPERFLRSCRLEAAHRELLLAEPGSTSVKAVALRWGFAHPATFVRLHVQRYGTPPHLSAR